MSEMPPQDPEPDVSETIEFIRQFQAGDKTALGPLFQRLHERVLRYVRIKARPALQRRVGVEDLVQESMIAVFLALDRFEGSTNSEFVRYIAQICERKIIGVAKREEADKRDYRLEESLEYVRCNASTWALPTQYADTGTAAVDRLSREEVLRILDECVASLEPDHRDVILQRDIAGATLEETARVLGRETPQAVSRLYGQAKLKLAQCANEHGLLKPSGPGR
jgi:RNA polymerase sigma-70 factor (ECF subfamily)